MSCTLPHTYEVYDEGIHDKGMYRGSSESDAVDTLRLLNHSEDFNSGAFVLVTHKNGSFCAEATRGVQRRAS